MILVLGMNTLWIPKDNSRDERCNRNKQRRGRGQPREKSASHYLSLTPPEIKPLKVYLRKIGTLILGKINQV